MTKVVCVVCECRWWDEGACVFSQAILIKARGRCCYYDPLMRLELIDRVKELGWYDDEEGGAS